MEEICYKIMLCNINKIRRYPGKQCLAIDLSNVKNDITKKQRGIENNNLST